MKKAVKKWQGVVLILAVFALLGAFNKAQAESETWTTVGNAGFSAGESYYPKIAFNPSTNQPYVVYMDDGNSSRATVMKFNGTSWDKVGPAGFSEGFAFSPNLAFNPSTNQPYVVFMDSANSYKATVMKFNGSSWDKVGPAGFSTSSANYPNLTFDPLTNQPYVEYLDWNTGKINVVKFDGSSWKPWDLPGFSDDYSASEFVFTYNLSTKLPYVAYIDRNLNKIMVMKFNGTSWSNVGSVVLDDGVYPNNINLAFNPSTHQPYIMFRNPTTVMKFDGTSWSQVGERPSNCDSNGNIAFNSANNQPYIICMDNDLNGFVKKFDGSSWSIVGSASFSKGVVNFPNLVFDHSTNQPNVVYADSANSNKATVMKLDSGDHLSESLSLNKSTYNTGENIVFNWTPVIANLKKYKIAVYNENNFLWILNPPSYYYNLSGISKNIGVLPAGKYHAHLVPYDSFTTWLFNNASSNTVDFIVERAPIPGPISNIYTTQKEYGANEHVVIKWSSAKNATEYKVNIFNPQNYVAENSGVAQTNRYETQLPIGSYRVMVQPRNSSGDGPMSENAIFKVTASNNPVFPVRDALKPDGSLNGWYASTYWGHDVMGAYQRGAIDINNEKGDEGVNVYAVQDGVVFSKSTAHLIIEHTKTPLILTDNKTRIDTWYSQYGHMSDPLDADGNPRPIKKGEKVYKNKTVVGRISDIGASEGSHLHFFISKVADGDCYKSWDEDCFKQAISPYWLHGVYSANKRLYADDLKETRAVYPWEDPQLYDKVIFLNPPSYPADIDKGQNIK